MLGFAVHNLSVLAYANGFTLWHYKAEPGGLDAAVEQSFFNEAADLLAGGDMVMVSAPEGGRMLCVAGGQAGVLTLPLG